jgi:hypothetical protein
MGRRFGIVNDYDKNFGRRDNVGKAPGSFVAKRLSNTLTAKVAKAAQKVAKESAELRKARASIR